MNYIKNLVYKGKYVVKNTIKQWRRIIRIVFEILGLLLTFGECFSIIFNSQIMYEVMRNYSVWIFVGCVVFAFFNVRTKLKYEYFLNGTDIKINITVSDVLIGDAAIVIPTNTTFDTKMEDDFISVNSIQGQFQKKYFSNNLGELDKLLEDGLEGRAFKVIDRKSSKQRKYPLGTVSKVTYDNKHYYFVAIADINEYGKTVNTKFENILIALEGIWNQIDERGHIENLTIPLLGTGKAGIKDASRMRVIKEIIFSFVAIAKERKVTEKLSICIHPLDLEQKDLKIDELDEYLRYMCKFRYNDELGKKEGTVIN